MSHAEIIPLARPSITDAERAAADRALSSGRLVLGPENLRFEAMLAARTGRTHAVCVSSGTMALELALWALGVGPGDEVIVTAFGFVAAANAVRRLGATPVPADVEPATWNLDPNAVAAAITSRTRGVISIDQLGLCAEAAALEAVTREHGVWLLDDAACGLGSTDSAGVPGGGYGRVATLSFHPRKVITTGEGGALLTDDDVLAASLRALRDHGQRRKGELARVGTNGRLGEVAAAIGTAQLDRLEAMLAERRLLARGYAQRLAKLVANERIFLQQPTHGAMHSYQSYAALLADGCDRDRISAALQAAGIETGPATYAFHRIATYAGSPPAAPASDALHDRSISLPLYVGMRSGELDRVCDALAREAGR
jgi:dTDP-4-amino-4,6-dideoxygalactose transaminase